MISLLRKSPFVLALAFTVGSPVAVAQAVERNDQHEEAAFTGIHAKRGVGEKPNTARITDGKTFKDVTEQEYRERGYIPSYDKLPVLIIQRIPVFPEHAN